MLKELLDVLQTDREISAKAKQHEVAHSVVLLQNRGESVRIRHEFHKACDIGNRNNRSTEEQTP